MTRKLLLVCLSLLLGLVLAKPPTQNEVANAAILSKHIYDGDVAQHMKGNGEVIESHNDPYHGSYLIFKHNTGHCYVVMRGTDNKDFPDNILDWLTNLNTAETYDKDLDTYVQSGVKNRGDWTRGQIGAISQLQRRCTRDIIFTGHSLGGAVAQYLYYKYKKDAYYRDKALGQHVTLVSKSRKLKVVMFGTPGFIGPIKGTWFKQCKQDGYWYKYKKDIVPDVVKTAKLLGISTSVYRSMMLTQLSPLRKYLNFKLDQIVSVSYGANTFGHKCLLSEDTGFVPNCNNYRGYNIFDSYSVADHAPENYESSILSNGFGEEDYVRSSREENSTDSNFTLCMDVSKYNMTVLFEDSVYYEELSNSSNYIIARLLDNEEEVEYSVCGESGFSLLQCDSQCNCHEVTKNNRPNTISFCSSGEQEGSFTCLVDGVEMAVDYTEAFMVQSETKIGNYYLMDYLCHDEIHQRGNYIPEMSHAFSSRLSGFAIVLSLFLSFLI